jgi:MATE family multidrug resistance protein
VAASYLKINLFATPFTVTSMIMSGVFSGAGATVYSLVIFSFSTWAVRLPLAWWLGHMLWQEASGVFVAMLVSQVVQASSSMYILLHCDWYRFSSTAKRFSRKPSIT